MAFTSFYSALTGLNNNAQSINVIGNNLANINTTAFKTGRISFAELLGGAGDIGTTGNPIQVGLGSTVVGITPMVTQGSVAYTGRTTDVAISGNGMFVVETPGGGKGFTRAGNFGFTSDGELVNSEGFLVLGYKAVDGVLNSGGALSPVVVKSSTTIPPKATTQIAVSANLDSEAAVGSTFSTDVVVNDSLGATHTVTLTFTKAAPAAGAAATWNWTATIPAADFGGASTDPATQIGSGSIAFNSLGIMTAPTADPSPLSSPIFANGAAALSTNFDLIDDLGKPRFTGYAAESSVSLTSQNGYASSQLRGITIDSKGIISGTFDNGQSQPLAQLALANFPNVEGLQKFKGSTFVAFSNSGEPSIGTAGTGGRGTVTGSSLEQSNVDIAQEFTNLIVAQRGYQSNTRVITTTDQLYEDTINIIR